MAVVHCSRKQGLRVTTHIDGKPHEFVIAHGRNEISDHHWNAWREEHPDFPMIADAVITVEASDEAPAHHAPKPAPRKRVRKPKAKPAKEKT